MTVILPKKKVILSVTQPTKYTLLILQSYLLLITKDKYLINNIISKKN